MAHGLADQGSPSCWITSALLIQSLEDAQHLTGRCHVSVERARGRFGLVIAMHPALHSWPLRK